MVHRRDLGIMARYRLTMPDVVGLLWTKTGTMIQPDQIRTSLARQGALSAPMTAAFRLLEREIRRDYEAHKP
ncbi:MAG: hypothetical protein KJ667_01680 [Alphaproteobacteria bacterium]|nr:hypothetical protein [Alphaproteobacteria bacterium]